MMLTDLKRLFTPWFTAVLLGMFVVSGWSVVARAQGPETVPATATAEPGFVLDASVKMYDRMEWRLEVPFEVVNPYDPDEVEVIGVFTPEDGYQVVMPAFWIQPMAQTCIEDCAIEVLEPDGDPEWRIRFAPNRPGRWTYVFQARREGVTLTLESGEFDIAVAEVSGFVRPAGNSQYFAFENGNAYLPIGHNLAWSWNGAGGIFAYQRWLRDLAANGGNYARLFVDTPWFIGFEWDGPAGDYTAAQDDFWRLDRILETAAEEGIYLDIVVLWHQALSNYAEVPVLLPAFPLRADTSADWTANPYNVLNGGFLTSTTQFFTESETVELFQRRLRYLVARWGYSTHVLAWDLLSEADQVAGYSPQIVLPWLETMAGYLREIDPYDHMITVGAEEIQPELLELSAIDFAQVRYYQRRPVVDAVDQVVGVAEAVQEGVRLSGKPVLLTEYSLSPWYEPTEEDPSGIHISNTLWASLMSGAAGPGASWWWDTYLDAQQLLGVYRPLARFVSGIPWSQLDLAPVQARLVSPRTGDYRPLVVSDFDRRFLADQTPDTRLHVLTADGSVPDMTQLSSYIYGQTFNSQRNAPQTYQIIASVDTELTVGVASVSPQASSRLMLWLDETVIAELELSAGTTSTALTVPILAGEHVLELDNTGDDWLQIEGIRLEEYVAPLRSMALADREAGLLLAWFHNREYTWLADDELPSVPPDFQAVFTGMPEGQYRVEFWDPYTGQVIGEDRVQVVAADAGELAFSLLPIERSLAVRAFPADGLVLPTVVPTATRGTATPLPTATDTATLTPTSTPTDTATGTATTTALPSVTATASMTPSLTNTVDGTPIDAPTETIAVASSATVSSSPPSNTPAAMTATLAASGTVTAALALPVTVTPTPE
jgi:hypothetical protein